MSQGFALRPACQFVDRFRLEEILPNNMAIIPPAVAISQAALAFSTRKKEAGRPVLDAGIPGRV